MGRLIVACSVLALLLGGCSSSLSDAGIVTAADVEATARSAWASGEQPLTAVIEAPAVQPRRPAPPYRLVSDQPDAGFFFDEDVPPAGGPPMDPPIPEAPAVELQPVPVDEPMPLPREVISAPCEVAPVRLCKPDPCCWNPCEQGYVGFSPSILPGLGAGIEFGLHIKRTQSAIWSLEVGVQYQDFWKEFTNERGDGGFNMLRLGTRVRFNPGSCGHWTLRFGGTWFEAEGTPVELDISQIEYRGDYIGAYIGIGYEYDLGKRWSMGPEVALVVAGLINKRPDRSPTATPFDGREEVAIVPMFLWHFNYRL